MLIGFFTRSIKSDNKINGFSIIIFFLIKKKRESIELLNKSENRCRLGKKYSVNKPNKYI